MARAKIISLVNEKGGCAKTNTTYALGSLLSNRGLDVLLLDLDKQADLTSNLKVPNDKVDIYEVAMGKIGFAVEEIHDHLWIIPGTNKLKNFERHVKDEFPHAIEQKVLENALEDAFEEVDVILIDCPPDIDKLISVNAFAMSDYVLIPTDPHPNGISGAQSVIEMVEGVKEHLNPKLEVIGVLFTLFDRRVSIDKDLYDQAKGIFGDLLFDTHIRRNPGAKEATAMGVLINDYDKWKMEQSVVKIKKQSIVVRDYQDFTDELLERLNDKK